MWLDLPIGIKQVELEIFFYPLFIWNSIIIFFFIFFILLPISWTSHPPKVITRKEIIP